MEPYRLPLKDNEELDKEILDALKDALDDLEIIDVERKPDILVKNLEQGANFQQPWGYE